MTLQLDADATLIGVPDLIVRPFTRTSGWARRAALASALVLGEGLHNVAIVGQGTICGNELLDPQGEDHIRGPHAVLLANCKNVQIRDITIRDAGTTPFCCIHHRRRRLRA